MVRDPTITLSIEESGERPNTTYLFHVLLDGKALISNQGLSLPDSQAVREISRSFGTLFEQGCRPEKDADDQRALGAQLFDLWLATSWEKIKAAVPVGSLRFLVIASEVPEILNLPWELLLPPEGDFLCINPLFRIRRFPSSAKQMATFTGELRPGPLRLLFMACSPTDQPTLDYEREEEALFRAIYGQDVAFDSCDLGTFEELKEKVSEFKPHIVHLTGHGAVLEGQGRFAFEKEDGTADLVPSEDLRRFLAGSGVQCVFVSGCQSGKAPREVLAGICQSLVGAEVPLAVGWAASIADDLATNFARTFYRTLKDGQPVDRALLLARQEAWKACEKRGDPSWTLPVIYSSTNQIQIFDPDPQRPPEVLTRQNMVLDALPGMKEGYAEHFVGRRREQQRLLPALRSGDLQVVIITGLGGSGKSTLANRLARKLETYGFMPIPVSSSNGDPLNSARLLQAFGDAFRQFARKERTRNTSKADELEALAMDMNNPHILVESRLHDAVAALNENHFLLLLDNFESNMDESDLHILDSEISGFYKYLLESLSGGSRAIITTRYQPSDAPVLPAKVRKEDLGDFPESSFLKILRRDPEVERRIRSGELPMALLRELYKKFGGTPRFLLQIREAIKVMDTKLMEAELAKVELPAGTEPGELQKLRDKYFADIFTERLYGYLNPESQKALCQAAVYGVPVTLEGLAAVAGEPLDRVSVFARSWQDRAFAYQETGKSEKTLWIGYGLLRGWLLARLSLDEQKDAHKAAGDFLVEMDRKNRCGVLGLSRVDCLMEARSKYLMAQEIKLALGLTDRLSGIFFGNGFYDGVRRINAEMLSYEEHPSNMNWIARTYFEQGVYGSAQIWYQRGFDTSAYLNQKDMRVAMYGLATIDLKKGDYDLAHEKFETVMKIMHQIGDREGEAAVLHELATIDWHKGDYDSAREKFETVMGIMKQIGNRPGEASTLIQMAYIDLEKGDYLLASEKFEASMKIWRQVRDRSGEAKILYSLATIDLIKEDYGSASEKLEASMKIRQQIGDRSGEASTWHQLGVIDINKGDYELAYVKFNKSIDIFKQIGELPGEASALHQLGVIDIYKSDYDSAHNKLVKSLAIRQRLRNRAGEAAAFHQLGISSWKKGKNQQGLQLVALSYLINVSIAHEKSQISIDTLSSMASELKYTQESFDIMLKEVAESYSKDRGQSLLVAAFPKA